MAEISGAGASLDIKLGQVPQTKIPAVNLELQGVYASVHLLSQYLDVLRGALEGGANQEPSESLKFRRSFWAPAGQAINAGAIVSPYGSVIVNGLKTGPCAGAVEDGRITVGSTGTRALFGVYSLGGYVALTSAAAGELVRVGIGPGVISVPGAKCGQILWGAQAESILTIRQANTVTQYLSSRPLSGDGGVYLNNIVTYFDGFMWEGYWMPGYPFSSGGTFFYNRTFLFPLGVCIADGYGLIADPMPN